MSKDLLLEVEPSEDNTTEGISIDQAFIALKEAKEAMDATHEQIKPQLVANTIDSDTLTQIMNEPYKKYNSAFELVQHLLMKSREAHPEAWEALADPERRKSFIKELPLADLLRYTQIEYRSEDSEQDIKDNIVNSLTIDEFIQLYEDKQPKKKEYRTKKNQTNVTMTDLPDKIATITAAEMLNYSSFNQSGNAYLAGRNMNPDFRFDNGAVLQNGLESSRAKLLNSLTKEGVDNLNIPTFNYLYTIFLHAYEKNNYRPVPKITMSITDLLRVLKYAPGTTQKFIDAKVNELNQFNGIIGVIETKMNGKIKYSYYTVFVLDKYDATTNEVTISSEYFNHVIVELNNLYQKKDKSGNKLTQKNGRPLLTKPIHAYDIDAGIVPRSTNISYRIIQILQQTIRRQGNQNKETFVKRIGGKEITEEWYYAHISFDTILSEVPELAVKIQNSKNKNTVIKRELTKVWDTLRENTHISEEYEDIKLPKPTDVKRKTEKKTYKGEIREYVRETNLYSTEWIPTVSNMHSIVFKIYHKGKK